MEFWWRRYVSSIKQFFFYIQIILNHDAVSWGCFARLFVNSNKLTKSSKGQLWSVLSCYVATTLNKMKRHKFNGTPEYVAALLYSYDNSLMQFQTLKPPMTETVPRKITLCQQSSSFSWLRRPKHNTNLCIWNLVLFTWLRFLHIHGIIVKMCYFGYILGKEERHVVFAAILLLY